MLWRYVINKFVSAKVKKSYANLTLNLNYDTLKNVFLNTINSILK